MRGDVGDALAVEEDGASVAQAGDVVGCLAHAETLAQGSDPRQGGVPPVRPRLTGRVETPTHWDARVGEDAGPERTVYCGREESCEVRRRHPGKPAGTHDRSPGAVGRVAR